MKFGESLKQERELRGITLEEISQHTKVHVRFLEAIEHDDLDALPAKAFAKGFLRAYARMIGLDEEQVITNFEYYQHTLKTDHYPVSDKEGFATGGRYRLVLLTLFLIIIVLLAIIIFYYYHGNLHLSWL